jgi:hypothetical protein
VIRNLTRFAGFASDSSTPICELTIPVKNTFLNRILRRGAARDGKNANAYLRSAFSVACRLTGFWAPKLFRAFPDGWF